MPPMSAFPENEKANEKKLEVQQQLQNNYFPNKVANEIDTNAYMNKSKSIPIDHPPPRPKLKYPLAVFFIFSNEFCERFSYYGMRTILALYLTNGLGYTEDTSTMIYHTFVMLCYFTPLFGGIIADSWLGKYRTILYVSILYAIGNVTLAVGAIPNPGVVQPLLSLLGLFLIASGTGGIKPCVSSFGGDQFVVPEQDKQLQTYFSIYYFSVNAGSVISTFLTPMLREEVKCFDQDTCYPVAFGVPAILMVVSIFIFVGGKRLYKMKAPQGNIAGEVWGCCSHAIYNKCSGKSGKKEHWLDHADDKYNLKLIEDIKNLLTITYLFTPTIIFWSLYEQQGSRWTFQANHMDGQIGNFTLQPDQMQTLNAVMCLAFIPLFEYLVYPALAKIRLVRTSLQKISWGGILAAIAFLISGLLELKIEANVGNLPGSGQAQLRLYNSLDCDVQLTSDFKLFNGAEIPKLSQLEFLNVDITDKSLSINLMANIKSDCSIYNSTVKLNQTLQGIVEKEAFSYLFTVDSNNHMVLESLPFTADDLKKTDTGNPKLNIINGLSTSVFSDGPVTLKFKSSDPSGSVKLTQGTNGISDFEDLAPESYAVTLNGIPVGSSNLDLKGGVIYAYMISGRNSSNLNGELFAINKPEKIHMLWQIPQYIVITAAEIMFSITGIEFAFTQAPDSMKSVISSIWLLTDAFGNVILIIVAGTKIFSSQAYEYFLFAGLMACVMVIFIILAMRYKYVTPPAASESRRSSLYLGSHRGSLHPDSRRGSLYPGSRRGSLHPDSRRGSLYPGSRRGSLYPEL